MALTFDTTAIADKSILHVEREGKSYWSPLVERMSFATMLVGINDIKDEDAADKFYKRYRAYLIAGGTPSSTYMSLETVRKFIGLRTNAGTYTDAAYKKRLIEWLGDTVADFHAAEVAVLDGREAAPYSNPALHAAITEAAGEWAGVLADRGDQEKSDQIRTAILRLA